MKIENSYINNSIVDRDKNDTADCLFRFGENGQDRFYLNGYIIFPISRLNNIYLWIKSFFKYKYWLKQEKKHKKIALNYKMPKTLSNKNQKKN